MITIISGVPGSGKTSKVIEMIMEELKAGRRIYTVGIPELLLNVRPGGDPHLWQTGKWLHIDSYQPDETKRLGIQSQWMPRGCPKTCPYLSTCSRVGVERPDSGSLVVIDEAHQFFPQRASGQKPPPYIEALNVHRHQGLDFWLLTQRPSFLDPFVRGLTSRHLHISLSAFSFGGSRNLYQWSEYQEVVNRASKLLAHKSTYKPSPAVFPLYASATVHTTLDQRMPTIMKVFILSVVILVGFAFFAFSHFNSKVAQAQVNPSPMPTSNVTFAPPASAVKPASSVQTVQTFQPVQPISAPAPIQPVKVAKVAACISNSSKCICYDPHGVPVDLGDQNCRIAAIHPTTDFAYPDPNNSMPDIFKPSDVSPKVTPSQKP